MMGPLWSASAWAAASIDSVPAPPTSPVRPESPTHTHSQIRPRCRPLAPCRFLVGNHASRVVDPVEKVSAVSIAGLVEIAVVRFRRSDMIDCRVFEVGRLVASPGSVSAQPWLAPKRLISDCDDCSGRAGCSGRKGGLGGELGRRSVATVTFSHRCVGLDLTFAAIALGEEGVLGGEGSGGCQNSKVCCLVGAAGLSMVAIVFGINPCPAKF